MVGLLMFFLLAAGLFVSHGRNEAVNTVGGTVNAEVLSMSRTPQLSVALDIGVIVAIAVVVVSVLVVTLVIALTSGRGRAIVSALLAAGLLVFFLLAAVRFVSYDRAITARTHVERQKLQAEIALAGMLEKQRDVVKLAAAEPAEAINLAEPTTEKATPDGEATDAAEEDKSGAEAAESKKPAAAADDRPKWIGEKPFKDGAVYKVPVTVGPWPTSLESMKLLPAAVDDEIAKYAVSRVGNPLAANVKLPHDYVMKHMIQEDVWEEPVKIDSFDDVKGMVGIDVWENTPNAADGEWTRLHVLLKFDRDVNQRLDDGWDRVLRIERLEGFGALGAIALIVLAAVYSYLKIDLKTGGAYRGRLRAGALAAILALIAIVLLNHA